MSFANNIENKNELLGGKKLKVKYIPGGNFMQMSASEESCEDTSWGSGGFFKLEKSVIAALNVADDIAVLEEGEMTKSELKKLKKKMKIEKRRRFNEDKKGKVKDERKGKVKEEKREMVSKYAGLWRMKDGAKVFCSFLSLSVHKSFLFVVLINHPGHSSAQGVCDLQLCVCIRPWTS